MKKGLYPITAGVLILLLILSMAFEDGINTLPTLTGIGLLILVGLVCYGAVLLAFWDTAPNDNKGSK